MRRMLRTGALIAAAAVLGFAAPALAIPELQLYLEGATYDATTQTWTLQNINSTDPLRLWAIGNVAGPGSHGAISGVRLAVAYPTTDDVTVTLTGSTISSSYGWADPSVAATPSQPVATVTDGSIPTLSDGSALPSHGVYGAGTYWQEFKLGDFTEADSPIGDFITAFPTAPKPNKAQINVYEVSLAAGSARPEWLHFDLYNSVQAGNSTKAVFAPFSHDAGGPPGQPPDSVIPEPGTLLLLGSGLLGLAGEARRRKEGTEG